LYFDIDYVLEYAKEKNTEVIGIGEEYVSGAKKGQEKTTQGSLYGKLTRLIHREVIFLRKSHRTSLRIVWNLI